MTTTHSFIAAPLLVLAYGVLRFVDGLDGVRGPGLAWTTGHLAFLAALLLFVPIMTALRRLAGAGRFATSVMTVGLTGIAVFVVQFGIDIVAGLLAADRAELSRLTAAVTDLPGVEPVVYGVGPILFYTALVTLVSQLAVRHRVPFWAAGLVLVGTVLPLVSKDLLLVSAISLLIPFLALAQAVRAGAAVAPVSATA